MDGSKFLASHLGGFTPGTYWIGGWISFRAGLEVTVAKKIKYRYMKYFYIF
jgi:hypothetical protein